MLGLSIDGPGSRTADPVPDDMTRKPALLRTFTEKATKAAARLTLGRGGPPWNDSMNMVHMQAT
jgi:hypothetical protein